MDKGLDKARRILREAATIVVLTGAGISAESGLETFRGKDGIWGQAGARELATASAFEANPDLVWRFYNARRRAAEVATPNAGHLALARLELERARRARADAKRNNPFILLTQNIDGLHQQAGSQNVLELHGSVWKVRCTECSDITSEHPVELPILPRCADCGGLLRPHIVWFGEMLEPEIVISAEHHVTHCDVLLVIGTSGVVRPAANYPAMAAQRGIPVLEVNTEKTRISELAKVCLIGKAGEIVPALIA